ncbi:hypothetical protein FisN_30Lh028 [Fistulifera solaris]|uniref:Uncharacterized protein n=1 Tax=Fistulifera solaris TaxID=1519565 RepID=A0A1Z5JJ04_FISSO|nr:hypothetical protein FisN_30Lh028 [Fistulifera solaris]|eukprot:GAX13741.1 hypothetical protein FisN_30Lh028 [Fistulifera solaris]
MTTPDKVPCRGFQGDKKSMTDLFRQSLGTGPPVSRRLCLSPNLDLPAYYPGAAHFRISSLLTEECMWILVTKSCQHELGSPP